MKTARRDHDADGELREKGLAELSHVVIRVWIIGEVLCEGEWDLTREGSGDAAQYYMVTWA